MAKWLSDLSEETVKTGDMIFGLVTGTLGVAATVYSANAFTGWREVAAVVVGGAASLVLGKCMMDGVGVEPRAGIRPEASRPRTSGSTSYISHGSPTNHPSASRGRTIHL